MDGTVRRRVVSSRISWVAAQLRAGDSRGMTAAYELIEQSGSLQSRQMRRELNALALATGNSRAKAMVDLRAAVSELTIRSGHRPHPVDNQLPPVAPTRRDRQPARG
jgi:hypothetical protein